MSTLRLEAFSDAVIAIVITIMVLELKVPEGTDLGSLQPLPKLLTYILSFVYLAIYWNNHHHLLQATARANGSILWANTHLLFWLSLVPVVTGWTGEHPAAKMPAVVYGAVLLMAAIAYYVLQLSIIKSEGRASRLKEILGKDLKGKVSPVLYAVAIGLSFVSPWAAYAIYAFVALLWLVPDRRIESRLDPA